MTTEDLTYETAFTELEGIMQDLQDEKVSVDELGAKVKRAAELITFSNTMLRSTEAEVNRIVKELGI